MDRDAVVAGGAHEALPIERQIIAPTENRRAIVTTLNDVQRQVG
jgi:hypothetical protein